MDIVGKILQFNRQNQEGQGPKVLTPNQILSRLPITLAQLESGNNSKKLKNETYNYYIFCIVQRSYPRQFITI